MKPRPPKKYPVSDQALRIVNQFVSMASAIEIDYGGVHRLVSHPQWDREETLYFRQQIHALRLLIVELDAEFASREGAR